MAHSQIPWQMNSIVLPSGNLTSLLNMTIEIVDFPIQNGGSFHSYVSLPEGKPLIQRLEFHHKPYGNLHGFGSCGFVAWWLEATPR